MQNFVPQNYFPTVLDVAIKADFSRQTEDDSARTSQEEIKIATRKIIL